jgi:hypothetical protein
MAVKHLDLNFLKSSGYSANTTTMGFHLPVATFTATLDVILFGG